MSSFISGVTLNKVVQRLGASGAKSSLADYLIFRRALVLARAAAKVAGQALPTAVVTGLQNAAFQKAIAEFAASEVPNTPAWDGSPYFSPFGAARDKGRGFKSAKYPSNGPSDTAGGWQSQGNPPLTLRPATKPKEYEFPDRSGSELRGFFVSKARGPAPTALDAACWWFRATDLEKRFGEAQPPATVMVKGFREDIGLKEADAKGLFGEPIEADEPIEFGVTCAGPGDYLPSGPASAEPATPPRPEATADPTGTYGNLEEPVKHLCEYVAARGYVFEPWQVAAFVTAVRTKPFLILAGISGTGKSQLPQLVAEATGAAVRVVPVRPDWVDSSQVIGYERIDGKSVAGELLTFAKEALSFPERQHFFVLDEMNIARVEYYFAEVLSVMEGTKVRDGVATGNPLAPRAPEKEWSSVGLPPNLCIVGSVNMDETTHGFSKKVLDRAFVIEFSDPDLRAWPSPGAAPSAQPWPLERWRQKHARLWDHPDRSNKLATDVIDRLVEVNEWLEGSQAQVGYRVRDEVVLFCLNARDCPSAFTLRGAGTVDPLDIALLTKIMPRVQGGGEAVRRTLHGLLEFVRGGSGGIGGGRRAYPLCEERLKLMADRLDATGFASFWM